MKSTILILSFIALALGGYIAFQMYNKPHKDLTNEKAQFVVTASEIFNEFSSNEEEANSKYLNKIVEIEGMVSKVERDENASTQIYLKTDDPMFGIIAAMDSAHEIKTISEGNKIKLRGYCSGYLMDVAINQAVIIE